MNDRIKIGGYGRVLITYARSLGLCVERDGKRVVLEMETVKAIVAFAQIFDWMPGDQMVSCIEKRISDQLGD